MCLWVHIYSIATHIDNTFYIQNTFSVRNLDLWVHTVPHTVTHSFGSKLILHTFDSSALKDIKIEWAAWTGKAFTTCSGALSNESEAIWGSVCSMCSSVHYMNALFIASLTVLVLYALFISVTVLMHCDRMKLLCIPYNCMYASFVARINV